MFKRRQRFQTDHWEQPEDHNMRQAPESNSIGVRGQPGQQNEVQASQSNIKTTVEQPKSKANQHLKSKNQENNN